MAGHRASDEFREEHANFWTLMQQIIHGLRNNYPSNQDKVIGWMGQLNLQLSTLRRAGEMMGLSYPPSDVVLDAPPQYFTARAQRHQNYFGTNFGYSCWYTQGQLGYAIADLLHQRDHTRVADQLEQLLVSWQLTEMRAFPRHLTTHNHVEHPADIVHIDVPPYYTPGAGRSKTETGPVRVHITMPAPTDTIYGVAQQTRHRPAPYLERGARPRHRGNARLIPPMPKMDLQLPNIMHNSDIRHAPLPTLPAVRSFFTPYSIPGHALFGIPNMSVPPLRGMQYPSIVPAPDTGDSLSVLNAHVGETLNKHLFCRDGVRC
ncbi:hypothetical protein DTO013E5_5792 [Penicillium roqueforti]|uniref:Uncharacterized protein n=1 Tax=Penicillium roqueforti (strain FM164) TaxID=1365484 RepID=W6QAF1_PENRF|nr:hypothetical protein CBS147372_8390 [Penicillium roqueforti]CDM33001.1 hypothetical protein PROQFM164_S02g003152 [Penicillium roqueforti FM164]KAI2740198.1 hypothetical protein DTO012A1_5671 [Penicillium roqueforti]KAI2748795.1 hypothetical protein DTO013F2_6054 [Penicillium roqueforti]KAI2771799.1 hypothetical protein DTO012A8_3579 [Penicillium roqueforti]